MSIHDLIQLTRKVEELEAQLEVAKEALGKIAALPLKADSQKESRAFAREALAKLNLK